MFRHQALTCGRPRWLIVNHLLGYGELVGTESQDGTESPFDWTTRGQNIVHSGTLISQAHQKSRVHVRKIKVSSFGVANPQFDKRKHWQVTLKQRVPQRLAQQNDAPKSQEDWAKPSDNKGAGAWHRQSKKSELPTR